LLVGVTAVEHTDAHGEREIVGHIVFSQLEVFDRDAP
jgi:hypothetical protein